MTYIYAIKAGKIVIKKRKIMTPALQWTRKNYNGKCYVEYTYYITNYNIHNQKLIDKENHGRIYPLFKIDLKLDVMCHSVENFIFITYYNEGMKYC